VSACKSCRAEIEWAVTETGKRIPIDSERRREGNILLEHREVGRPPIARVLTREQVDAHRRTHAENLARGLDTGSADLFVSHFATCPNAAQHRRSA
jgi:hypothetical protein